MNIIVWVILGALVLVSGFLVSVYNGLITLKTKAQNAQKDIDVQLKRRYELIPNLVESVKGYVKHEKETLEKVTAARAGITTGSMKEKIESNNMLAETLKSLFAVAESYPDLKANQGFLDLQAQLTDTQDKIMGSQRFYNAYVQQYDERVQQFPNNIVAGLFGFHEKDFEYLDVAEGEKANVKVDFSEEK
jgi:LemA protein